MLTIFEKIEKGYIDLSDTNNNESLIMAYLKQAYHDGIEAGKKEVNDNLRKVYEVIDMFLENDGDDS